MAMSTVQDKNSPLNFQCVEQADECFSRKITEEAHQQALHANGDTHMSLSPSCSASSTGRKAQVMARHRRSTACIRMGRD
eukprot:1154193-Pelagomonas_calceolata.AAC.4